MTTIRFGIATIHSNHTELLARTLAGWLQANPLEPLEEDVALVQSNGMAEWLKMALAREAGVCAVLRTELPSRFAWRMYRQILGDAIPYQTPLDKTDMLWRLMRVLAVLQAPHAQDCAGADSGAAYWQPLRDMLGQQGGSAGSPDAAAVETCYQLAVRIADLFDQYQVYRPDWLLAWEQGHDYLLDGAGRRQELPQEMRWQPALWRLLMAELAAEQRQNTRAHLHRRALQALQELPGGVTHGALPRRVMVFGMSHLPLPVLELLGGMARHSQVLITVLNPCRHYWSDTVDGRELFAQWHRKVFAPAPAGSAAVQPPAERLAALPLYAMHGHANPLLAMWGRQVRDFIRLLEHFEVEVGSRQAEMPRIDCFDTSDAGTQPMLVQLQQQIRDLCGAGEPGLPLPAEDASLRLQITHSPMRELEALHDHLLDLLAQPAVPGSGLAPLAARDIVVMMPDVSAYAPLIQAVFGQYGSDDARSIPFAVADLAPGDVSTLVQAVQWLTQMPEARLELGSLSDWLATPAVAQRVGLDAQGVLRLQTWLQASGVRWGLDAEHRAQLGLPDMGWQNTAWFGLERMLLGYSSSRVWQGVAPLQEVAGLAAADLGALAWLLQRLRHWREQLSLPAAPQVWAERWRAMLGDFLAPGDAADKAALQLLEQALQRWLDACVQADFTQPLPLAVARQAWLEALAAPAGQQRFHAGSVTFCTLLPMRAIPFRVVCLLGMNEGAYPRQNRPDELDLMRQTGMLRAGDRSRAQDDRQLMLEALLSARQQLLISWVGRSARDNTERAPSVLVAQLQDEIAARWGEQALRRCTTVHALQPFHPCYFSQPAPRRDGDGAAPSPSWAKEWHPHWQQQRSQALQALLGRPGAVQQCEPGGCWSVRQLAGLWKKPVQQWFESCLQTRFSELQGQPDDCEPLGVAPLQSWQILDDLKNHLAPLVEQGEDIPALEQAALQQLQNVAMQGVLPLGAQAQIWQRQCLDKLAPLLRHWHLTCARWPLRQASPVLRWPLADAGAAADGFGLRIEDYAPQRRGAAHPGALPQAPDGSGQEEVLYLQILVNSLQGRTEQRWLRYLLEAWLYSCLLGVQGEGRRAFMRVLALDACVNITLPSPEQARIWLTQALDVAGWALQQPRPFEFQTALTWWQVLQESLESKSASASRRKKPDTEPEDVKSMPVDSLAELQEKRAGKALEKARVAYDGSYGSRGGVEDPALARLWPDFAALHGSGGFEEAGGRFMAPLQEWLDACVEVQAYDEQEGDAAAAA